MLMQLTGKKRKARQVLSTERQVELVHWFEENREFIKDHSGIAVMKKINADLPKDDYPWVGTHLKRFYKAYNTYPLRRGTYPKEAVKSPYVVYHRDKLLELTATYILTSDDMLMTPNERVSLKKALDAFIANKDVV